MRCEKLLAAFTAACICSSGAWGEDATAKLNVGVVVGGHGFEEKPFFAMFEENPAITFTVLPKEKKEEVFADVTDWPYDVLVLYNMTGAIPETCRENFLKLLNRGMGLVILHHAIANYPDWPEYRKILGAKYFLEATEIDGVQYPRSEYTHGLDFKVHVEDPNHPITQGISDFTIHDEVYRKWILDPGNHVLLTTDCPESAKELCWTRDYAKSKVCFLQLGHGPEAHTNPNYRELVARAIQWTAGRLEPASK